MDNISQFPPQESTATEPQPAPTCVVTFVRQPNGGGVVILVAKPEEGVEREASRSDVLAMCHEVIAFEAARLAGEQTVAAIARAQQEAAEQAQLGAVRAAVNGKSRGAVHNIRKLFGR